MNTILRNVGTRPASLFSSYAKLIRPFLRRQTLGLSSPSREITLTEQGGLREFAPKFHKSKAAVCSRLVPVCGTPPKRWRQVCYQAPGDAKKHMCVSSSGSVV